MGLQVPTGDNWAQPNIPDKWHALPRDFRVLHLPVSSHVCTVLVPSDCYASCWGACYRTAQAASLQAARGGPKCSPCSREDSKPPGPTLSSLLPLGHQQPAASPGHAAAFLFLKGLPSALLFSEEESPHPSHPQLTPYLLRRPPLGHPTPWSGLRSGAALPAHLSTQRAQFSSGHTLLSPPPLRAEPVGDPPLPAPRPQPLPSNAAPLSSSSGASTTMATTFSSLPRCLGMGPPMFTNHSEEKPIGGRGVMASLV